MRGKLLSQCCLWNVEVEELGAAMVKFNILSPADVRGSACRQLFQLCDRNGDGSVDYEEFGKRLGMEVDSAPMYLGQRNSLGGESQVFRQGQLKAKGVMA